MSIVNKPKDYRTADCCATCSRHRETNSHDEGTLYFCARDGSEIPKIFHINRSYDKWIETHEALTQWCRTRQVEPHGFCGMFRRSRAKAKER